jgi:hypothetical protein
MTLLIMLEPHVTSSLFCPFVLLNILFFYVLTLCSSPDIRDQVSHPYKTADNAILLYVSVLCL